MTRIQDVRRLLDNRLARYAETRPIRYGVLGDGRGRAASNIYVPNAPDYVWARETTESVKFFPILNRSVVTVAFDLPVAIGYTDIDPSQEQVIGIHYDGMGANTTLVNPLGNHHLQHELGGGDDVFIDGLRFEPGLVGPTDPESMQLKILPFTYYWKSFEQFPASTTIDLSAFLPGSGESRYVMIALDPVTQAIVYRPGLPFTPSILGLIGFDAIPHPSGDEYPLGYVALQSSTTSLGWGLLTNSLGDARLHIGFPAHNILERLQQLEGYTGNNPNLATVGAETDTAQGFVHRLGNLLDVAVSDATNGQALVYNLSTNRWIPGASVSGVSSFIQLADAPASYTGASGRIVVVNAAATGLEFSAGTDIGSNAASIQSVNFEEQLSDVTTPDTSHRTLYAKSDGLYVRAATGSIVGPLGATINLTSTGPSDISGASSLGVSTSAAKGDHVHRGIQSLNVPGNALLFGRTFIESGTGTTVAQSGNSILISASGGGGVAVSSIMVAGASPLQGNVFLVAGAGASLSQSGASITVTTTGTANAVSSISVAGNPLLQGSVFLVGGTGASLSQSGASITIVGTGSAAAAARVFNGRLSYNGDLAVTTVDVTAASVLYYLPYNGDQVSLYTSSSAWANQTFIAPSLTLVGLSPNSVYDIFGYQNGNEVTLETARWNPNNLVRTTGLSAQNGNWCAATNRTRVLLGTMYMSATSDQSEDSQSKRYLWNNYNRLERTLLRREPTATWTYNSTVWRQADASSANQVEAVIGIAEHPVHIEVLAEGTNNTVAGFGTVGIGINATSVNHSDLNTESGFNSTAAWRGPFCARLDHKGIGYYKYQWIESVRAGSIIFSGVLTSTTQAGMRGTVVA